MVSTGYATNLPDPTRTRLQLGIMFMEHATPPIKGIASTGPNRLLGVYSEYGREPLYFRQVRRGIGNWCLCYWVRLPFLLIID